MACIRMMHSTATPRPARLNVIRYVSTIRGTPLATSQTEKQLFPTP
jgi:hypothetical protein